MFPSDSHFLFHFHVTGYRGRGRKAQGVLTPTPPGNQPLIGWSVPLLLSAGFQVSRPADEESAGALATAPPSQWWSVSCSAGGAVTCRAPGPFPEAVFSALCPRQLLSMLASSSVLSTRWPGSGQPQLGLPSPRGPSPGPLSLAWLTPSPCCRDPPVGAGGLLG